LFSHEHDGGFYIMHEGTVKAVRLDKGFGFISSPNQPDVFFHASELIELPFDETLRERRVRFNIIGTGKGPKAAGVRAAE
jgi:cold shock CspA family protein